MEMIFVLAGLLVLSLGIWALFNQVSRLRGELAALRTYVRDLEDDLFEDEDKAETPTAEAAALQ